ncbi:hypothetical protein Ac2012v2_002094 [Leucoagaricus gongylophorus]
MAYTRRPPHRRVSPLSDSPAVFRKKYLLRRAIARTPSHVPSLSSPTNQDHRPVLVPLHPNLRRLPSRASVRKVSDRDMVIRDLDQVTQVGAKRKRSTNENALANGQSVSSRKRLRAISTARNHFSDETDMDLDTLVSISSAAEVEMSENGMGENEEEEGESESPSDDHLLHFATPEQLARLRKLDLTRLYTIAGLADDAELFTKHEIIDSLILAREDNASLASLPPPSPVDRGDNSSSSSLTDNGNVAGGEESDAATVNRHGLKGTIRRRVTLQDFGTGIGHIPKGRSMSMGNLVNRDTVNVSHTHMQNSVQESNKNSKRRTSARSSPTSSTPASTNTRQSPPATRLRTRKMSRTAFISSTTPSSANSSKTKYKQVEFNDQVVKSKAPTKRRLRNRVHEREAGVKVSEEGSDLADIDEVEGSLNGGTICDSRSQPSPRRLRSKEKTCDQGKEKTLDVRSQRMETRSQKKVSGSREKRVSRTSPSKRGVGGSESGQVQRKEEDERGGESESEEDEEEAGQEDEDGDMVKSDSKEDGDGVEDGGNEEEGEEGGIDTSIIQGKDEADELVSSTSTTSLIPRSRRTPLRKRSRIRNGDTTPDDGDVEDEGEGEMADSEEREVVDEIQGNGEESANVDEDVAAGSENEAAISQTLKTCGVVDEDVEMETVEEDIGEEDSETGEEEGDTDSELDVDVEGETDEDEVMDEEVDLAVATTKTLVRLRRGDLIRLCETRDLKPMGTKHQLAETLLDWRDRQANECSSPSSTGTIRPPSSTGRLRCEATASVETVTPVLLRSEHAHQDIPMPDGDKEVDPDLELDLESLGLEDREIPPEKLMKLEKIGSGGFKDVFIGKFKGRRVAISEFRGTLSAMDIKELKLLGGFDHPNIVRFLGVSIPENTKETPAMIVSELCSNGDLFDYIRNTNTPSLHKVLSMMLDIARGLEYLHARKPSVIHRDCKSSNILITARGTAKIADFGLAKVKQSTRSMVKSLVGTVNWQAPELWTAHPKYNHKVDVFSCALVFWEMLQWHLPTRKHPWEGMNEHAIYDIVGAKRQRPSVSGLRKQWCPEVIDLIERMWAQEHQDRPTMTEVVQELEKMVLHK